MRCALLGFDNSQFYRLESNLEVRVVTIDCHPLRRGNIGCLDPFSIERLHWGRTLKEPSLINGGPEKIKSSPVTLLGSWKLLIFDWAFHQVKLGHLQAAVTKWCSVFIATSAALEQPSIVSSFPKGPSIVSSWRLIPLLPFHVGGCVCILFKIDS